MLAAILASSFLRGGAPGQGAGAAAVAPAGGAPVRRSLRRGRVRVRAGGGAAAAVAAATILLVTVILPAEVAERIVRGVERVGVFLLFFVQLFAVVSGDIECREGDIGVAHVSQSWPAKVPGYVFAVCGGILMPYIPTRERSFCR